MEVILLGGMMGHGGVFWWGDEEPKEPVDAAPAVTQKSHPEEPHPKKGKTEAKAKAHAGTKSSAAEGGKISSRDEANLRLSPVGMDWP